MEPILSYTVSMDKDVTTVPADRVRAGRALAKAVEAALEKKIVLGYADIGDRMGFHRTMIPQHKNGTRPMARRVVLEYATVLKCDPVLIADDEVRMELAKDLQRFENDSNSYVVVKEHTDSNHTPIKIPREFLELDGVDPEHLATVRLANDENQHGTKTSNIIIIRTDDENPIKSGEMHVLNSGTELFVAKIAEERGGYIITPENANGRIEPSFRTRTELADEGISIAGVVYWRLSKN